MYVDEEVIEGHENEQPMPFDQLQQKEATRFLLQIVGTLPPRQQEVIQLKLTSDEQAALHKSAESVRELQKITGV